jgi:acetate kinase
VNAPPDNRILTLNRGSATLKAALYQTSPSVQLELSISVDRADSPGTRVTVKGNSGAPLLDSAVDNKVPDQWLETVFHWLEQHDYLASLTAAGHRFVHGGVRFRSPVRITPGVVTELERLAPLDPDHLPAALRVVRFVTERLPGLPQIGCFDTAFHSSIPKVAQMYALPRRYFDSGILRFGFHGLSYEYIVGELRALEGALAAGRVIIAHLGSGASMVALRQGKSVDTSMGFTPLEGLVMGTRSGDVDAGILFYLLDQGKMSPAELDECLNKRSGLLGVSGSSGDMRDLIEKAPHDQAAAEAVELFCYRAKKYLGAYAAALGGVDLVVFTGGIGEKAALVRWKICENLGFVGIQLDPQRNQANGPVISTSSSPVKVRVIETNEDLTIVRHVLEMIGRR